jgi:hypothetical protein
MAVEGGKSEGAFDVNGGSHLFVLYTNACVFNDDSYGRGWGNANVWRRLHFLVLL